MNDVFALPVAYNGNDFEFPFKIVAQGYTHRYVVSVDDVEVVYERDDQGAFRALIYHLELITTKLPERDLLEAISNVIQELTG